MFTFVSVGLYGMRLTAPRIKESLDDYRALRKRDPSAIVVHPGAVEEVTKLLQEVDAKLELVPNGGCRAWEFWLRDYDAVTGGMPA